jgi:hypothetical protein
MVVLTSACSAEETLREIKWSDPNLRGKLTAGEVIEPNADCSFAQLKVQSSQNEKKTFAILTINDPCITTASYALTGQVRYEGVERTGYLEMWNHFPDGKMYFSRTLGDSGPMQSLAGSSNWRPFTLPFYIGDTTKMRPVNLEFNIVLPGRGTVFLGPLKLVQFEKGESAATSGAKNAWWTDRMGGLVGGITGSVIGAIGFIIGISCWLGIARKLCFSLLGLMFAFGVISLAISLIALIYSQPYAVYYPLLLVGILCVTLPPLSFYTGIKQRYEQIELRKMHAMDMR